MTRPRTRVVQAPLAVASDGSLLVNAYQLARKDDIEGVMRVARDSGLPVFAGVVVQERLRAEFVHEADDALADVVGRMGPMLVRRRGR